MKIFLPRVEYKNSHIYLIQRKQDFDVAGVWYFYELGELINEMHLILWTANVQAAHKFGSEQEVEDFRKDFLYERQTEIIRIKKEQAR